jgi:hypothetical protein
MKSSRKRAPDDDDTSRQRLIRACRRHLKDLKRAYERPPAEVPVRGGGIPVHFEPVEPASYCASPAQLCAEIA